MMSVVMPTNLRMEIGLYECKEHAAASKILGAGLFKKASSNISEPSTHFIVTSQVQHFNYRSV